MPDLQPMSKTVTAQPLIYETTWLEIPALAVETAAVRLITVPELGAKIVSLFDKTAQREWLLPPADRPLKPVPYGASFVEQDMSGWDEMFPTIAPCDYPAAGSYAGKPLPDHGEVWVLPWQREDEQGTLRLVAAGRALPYQLTRTISVVDSNTLRFIFELINTGDESLIALWAAHPQFAIDAETQIVLPSQVREVVNVLATEDWGPIGAVHPWPTAVSRTGETVALDRVIRDKRAHRKLYLLPHAPVSWAALRQGASGTWLRLSWDVKLVPYLGIWVDEGSYNAHSTASLEPSTGYYDSLDVAWQNRRLMHLPPRASYHWYIDVRCGVGEL